jgi:hypothetical protein
MKLNLHLLTTGFRSPADVAAAHAKHPGTTAPARPALKTTAPEKVPYAPGQQKRPYRQAAALRERCIVDYQAGKTPAETAAAVDIGVAYVKELLRPFLREQARKKLATKTKTKPIR